ncbi:Vesicle coat complex COPI, beta' subunit [Trachipleistophora hominis]|uniref:Vesicle coat complex COPI, beta' subunit n=1 Tax=Trachipleistophora hominis TaxID=72359 RepID=L7JRG6_TRAHO|nr:Vesicle coat complex COPI, beta' subunit [Trachipleistophora hominis]
MDIQVVDDDRLLSCSLDMTLKLWNYKTNVLLMTFKGHTRGVNAISVYKNTFYSVGDDHCMRIWCNNACRVKEGISDKNIDHIKVTDELIVTGAEDGYYKIYKRQGEQLEHSVFVGSRVWDSWVEEDAFYVATDSGILIYDRQDAKVNRYLVDRGLLHIKADSVFLNDKEIGKINFEVERVSYNNKIMCMQKKDGFVVFSYLGFREKMRDSGKALVLNEKLVVSRDNVMIIYDDLEKETQFKILYGDFKLYDRFIVNYSSAGFVIYSYSGETVVKGTADIRDIFIIGNKVVISNECTGIIDIDGVKKSTGRLSLHKVMDMPVEYGHVHHDVLYFMSNNKLYYLLANGFFSMISYVNNIFLGIQNDCFCFFDKKLITKPIDEIIAWQCDEKKDKALEGREKECLSYLLKQKEYELALRLFDCKFEIYLQMNKLENAFKVARTPTEYKMLGGLFMRQGKFSKATEAFRLGGDDEMLFLCDFLGKRKFMKSGDNDSFMKCMYLKDKDGMRRFIVGSEFEAAFEKYY